MPEILTESFCERCGTRYTFESAAPRAAKLSSIKVLSRGLRNFVMSDDTSIDEAMAAARSETDREVTAQQLDAFHKTFNFCMTCRQYTCGNCWNEAEGRCLTCAPHLGQEVLPAPFPDLPADGGVGLGAAAATNGANGHATAEPLDTLAWPTMDLERDLDVEPEAAEASSELEPVEEIDAVARLAALGAVDTVTDDAPATPEEPVADVAEAPPVSATPVAEDGLDTTTIAAAAAASQTNDLMRRFRPGQSLDAEIEAYERQQAEADAARAAAAAAAAAALRADAPEPVVAPQPEPEAEPEPEVAAAPEPPTPVAPEVPDVPAAAAAPEAPTPAAPRDVVAQPTWRIVAPDPDVAQIEPTPAQPTAAQAEPQWPTRPQWPSQQPSGGLPFLDRPAQPTGGMEALWAASASEVADQPGAATREAGGVQPCVSCGLSLSATARFCRRCGTRQG